MKKIKIFAIISALAVLMISCASKPKAEATPEETVQEDVQKEPIDVNDPGWAK